MTSRLNKEQFAVTIAFLEEKKNEGFVFKTKNGNEILYSAKDAYINLHYVDSSTFYVYYSNLHSLSLASQHSKYIKSGWFWQKDELFERAKNLAVTPESVADKLGFVAKYIPNSEKYLTQETFEKEVLKKK